LRKFFGLNFKNGSFAKWIPVHERVPLDEVEAGLGQSEGVVVAEAGPGIGDLRPRGRKPVRVDRFLKWIIKIDNKKWIIKNG
jgi:hypothetical protein